ncbi:MAG: hypothetical protein IJ520_09700, partial [Synergistaceae bacterium]|nr:hypothetical protein [Synergistaceae bacterium]
MAEKLLDENIINESEVVRQRKDKLLRLKAEENFDPFVTEKWDRQDFIEDIKNKFEYLEAEQEAEDVKLVAAGRLMTIRRQGKAAFADLADETVRMQLYFNINTVGAASYEFFKKWVDTGDWIGIIGHPCRTRRGELTILVESYKLFLEADFFKWLKNCWTKILLMRAK